MYNVFFYSISHLQHNIGRIIRSFLETYKAKKSEDEKGETNTNPYSTYYFVFSRYIMLL